MSAKKWGVLFSVSVLFLFTEAALATPGGVLVTAHDADFHAQIAPQFGSENPTGAQHIIQRAIAYVTFGKPSPKLLLITDLRDPGPVYADPRLGIQDAGFTSFDTADYGSSTLGVLDLHTVDFGNYDAIIIASDFGGWLRQDELDILNARSNELINYINNGGGIVAFSESGPESAVPGSSAGGLTTHDRYGFLPFLSEVGVVGVSQIETGNTVTAAGAAIGLTNDDINRNVSHLFFTTTGGMDIIDVDAQSRVLSLATRGKVITSRGVTADLSITKTASTNPVIVGQNLTYTLTVKNAGPNAATNAILTDPLPNGMSFVSSSASQGSCNGTTTIICNLGSLENGKTATITIVVKAIAQGTITNTANITAVEPDPNPADNTATATVTANLPQADLSVSASASPDPVLVKKNLTYTIVVTNNGPQSATNVILTDQLPQGSHFISITLNNCSNNGSTISCNLGTLAKSQNTTITIVIQPLSEGTVTNVVSVAGTENDPNQSNNKATVVTDVVLPSCEHKDIVGLMCALKTTANNLDLLFNQLDHGLYETLVAVNNGRKLLSQGRSANLVDDSVTEALEQINLSIETFAELHSLLDLLNEQLANALGTITTMLEAPDLTPAQSAILTKLKLKLEAIEQVALEISNELEALQDKLDSGQSSGDIRSALEAAQEALANDNLDDARTSLNSAYQLIRTALRESKRLVRKKKLLIKNLVSAEGLLSRSTLTSQNENASTIPAQQTLGNGFAITESVHGSILFQTLDANVKSLRLRVYAISGRLVFDREALGSKVSFEGLDSRGAPLANGVYLVVLTVQRGDGSRIASQVQKIVWVR